MLPTVAFVSRRAPTCGENARTLAFKLVGWKIYVVYSKALRGGRRGWGCALRAAEQHKNIVFVRRTATIGAKKINSLLNIFTASFNRKVYIQMSILI